MSRRFSNKKYRKRTVKRRYKKNTVGSRTKLGGVSFSPASYPVGSPWKPNNISSWAGLTNGVSKTGNHFAFKGGIVEPHPESTSYKGGRKHKKQKHSKNNTRKIYLKGGRTTLMPQSLVNLGRSVAFSAGELVNNWSGKQGPLSPSPTVQPIANNPKIILPNLPNVPFIHRSAGKAVSSI